jgi:molybdopterin synthase catalytic subunit
VIATRTHALVDAGPLDLQSHVDAVADPRAGAVATFVGQVRDHDPSVDGQVSALDYSAHPDAQAILERLVADAAADPDVLGVACSHRTGLLEVGEAAIVVAVATAHRARAFEVCSALVEAVKTELPVWKREILSDGSHHWVGSA